MDSGRMAALVVAARGGDRASLDALLRAWRPRLVRFAARQLTNDEAAQDVVQETLAKVAQNIERLDQPEAFVSWIYTILRRDSIEYFRREQRFCLERTSLDEERSEHNAGEAEAQFAPSIDMQDCLGNLRTEDRELLSLHYWCGLELKELAPVFGIAVGALKTRLFRARGQLRELLLLPGAG
jgi:RNA polymerase sigma factor (sigma-70 family)